MVALTPNLFLPYAQPTDPADVPERMQALAEQIDNRLGIQEGRARPRAMAQFLGTIPNTIPGTSQLGVLTWQTTDFNTTIVDLGTTNTAVQPIVDASTTQLRVNWPGLWFVFAAAQIPSTAPSANIDELGLEILRNGTVTPQWCRSSTHETQIGDGDSHILDAASGIPLVAGDTIGLRAIVRRSSGSTGATFGRRSITLLRMTRS